MIIAIVRITIASERLIQMGDNTHHQDQVITLVSLRPTNNTVRAPVKEFPTIGMKTKFFTANLICNTL